MNIIKSDSTARMFLLIIWFFFFVSNLSFIIYLYFDHWIEKDNFQEAMKQLNTVYAPYLGAITLFYWGITGKRKKDEANKVGTAFTLAVFCSIMWNGIITFFVFPLVLQNGTIEESIENLQYIGGLLSWLVAGAIGYYFANPTQNK